MIIDDHGAFEAWAYGIRRSPMWKTVENGHLKREPTCSACDPDRKPPLWRRLLFLGHKVRVHHIIPFHVAIVIGRPELELDTRNLITLCEDSKYNHHLTVGHLGSYDSWAFSVKKLAKVFQGMTTLEIISNATYLEFLKDRPKDIRTMSPDEIEKIRIHVDVIMPKVKND